MNSSRLAKMKSTSNVAMIGGHRLVSKIETGKFIQTIHEHMDEGLTTGFDRITPQMLLPVKQ